MVLKANSVSFEMGENVMVSSTDRWQLLNLINDVSSKRCDSFGDRLVMKISKIVQADKSCGGKRTKK